MTGPEIVQAFFDLKIWDALGFVGLVAVVKWATSRWGHSHKH